MRFTIILCYKKKSGACPSSAIVSPISKKLSLTTLSIFEGLTFLITS